jgi:hypothetical protein
MRVLVCGGREYDDWWKFNFEMEKFWSENLGIHTIIHGDAKGADFMARIWAKYEGHEQEKYPADWKTYGKAAGSIRNQQMLDEGKPDLVIAFPGGTGTADMVSRAKKAGVEVIEIE